MAILICCLLLGILFALSQVQSRLLSLVFHTALKSQVVVIKILAFLFFPGVVIHELAHFLVASLLFVPTGEIEFVPVVYGNTVKLGSVAIAKTDLIRRFLIGVAPLFFGLAVMMGIYWFLSPIAISFNWRMFALLFVLFEIGNTMFASRKDLEGAVGIVILVIFFLFSAFLFHLPLVSWASAVNSSVLIQNACLNIGILLGIVIGMDSLFILLLLLVRNYTQRR